MSVARSWPPTISASPGCSIHVPTTIVFAWTAPKRPLAPVAGLISIDGRCCRRRSCTSFGVVPTTDGSRLASDATAVRHPGYLDVRFHGINVFDHASDDAGAAHILGLIRFVVLLKQPVDGGDHADDLFFRDLHCGLLSRCLLRNISFPVLDRIDNNPLKLHTWKRMQERF